MSERTRCANCGREAEERNCLLCFSCKQAPAHLVNLDANTVGGRLGSYAEELRVARIRLQRVSDVLFNYDCANVREAVRKALTSPVDAETQLPEDAPACPFCGQPNAQQTRKRAKT